MVKNLALVGLLAALPGLATAGSTLVYDRDGRVQTVVRDGPSGPIFYDGEGQLRSAVRDRQSRTGLVVQFDRQGVGTIGTSLKGGVGDQ